MQLILIMILKKIKIITIKELQGKDKQKGASFKDKDKHSIKKTDSKLITEDLSHAEMVAGRKVFLRWVAHEKKKHEKYKRNSKKKLKYIDTFSTVSSAPNVSPNFKEKVRKRDRTVHARCLSIDGMEIDKDDYERIRELAMYRYHCCGFGWGKSDPIPKGHYEFANKSQYHAKFIVKEHNGEGQEREIELKPYLGKFKEEDTPHKRTINTNSARIDVTLKFKVKDTLVI